MSTLPTPLRRQLERTIEQARTLSEAGARHALEALAVHEPSPYAHMTEAQRDLRRKLRAQARQLGDGESRSKAGAYEITHLAEKLAYDQWHRVLFARYLLENDLLISPAYGVAVTLVDCQDLAPAEGLKDAWAVAARFAAAELPEIFRADDPAGAVELSVNDRQPLVDLVTGLPLDVFTASDSLGWCYQFWQAKRKDEVNRAGNKIGADEISPVTQLFTEDYMVDFLLDNTLGAWHAGKVLAANPKLAETVQSEDELRQAVALPGCPWKYLRFIKGKDDKWTPAAGTFDGWPKSAAALRALDPCMGSGHFVVAMFERLVALRLAEEKLDEAAAVAAVIRDNLFGLEIDPRCTQIGAFNLALAAWRRVGHCKLPAMNLACSGLAPNTREADWLAIAGDNQKLQRGMERLYRLFQKAAVLGSLINPRAGEGDLLVAAFHELQPLLEKALAQETKDDTAHEMAVTARGLARAAEILAGQFTLVATNVPYLGRNKHDETLSEYCERVHPEAKTDLATCFVERCGNFAAKGGSAALVTPQNWLFLGAYSKLRLRLLKAEQWDAVAKLGPRAFETIGGEVVNVALVSITNTKAEPSHCFLSSDVTESTTPGSKADSLLSRPVELLNQTGQLNNPDYRVGFTTAEGQKLLFEYVDSYEGVGTGDLARFQMNWWEARLDGKNLVPFRSTTDVTMPTSGCTGALLWENGEGEMVLNAKEQNSRPTRGFRAWNKKGIAINRMSNLPVSLYYGEKFDCNIAAIIPKKESHLPAMWAFISDSGYGAAVREIDRGGPTRLNSRTRFDKWIPLLV